MVTPQTKPSQILPDLLEPINQYINVPLAAILVGFLKNTSVTPNQVTYASIFFGLASALCFSQGTVESIALAGLLLEATLVLDCADGQLARIKNSSSEWGRLLDGIAGYISYLAVVAGILVGLQGHYWSLAVISLITILRAISYDYFKQFMTSLVQEGHDWSEKDIQSTFQKIQESKSPTAVVYFYYLQIQQFIFRGKFSSLQSYSNRSTPNSPTPLLTQNQRDHWYEKVKVLAVFWKWHGPDLVLFLFILCALTGTLAVCLKPMAILLTAQFVATLSAHYFLVRHETFS
jgi:phosphatidylglycerophosphate synthase